MKVPCVIKCFKTVFSFAGFPNAVLSDRGTNIASHDFTSFLSQYNIKKLRTNSYHPSGNEIAERFNGVLKKSMLTYITKL